jgi:hypothetical protein
MKVIIPEDRLENLIFDYLDSKLENLEKNKGLYYKYVFSFPGENYGIMGWDKRGVLGIRYTLVDDIFSYFPIEKTEIERIIGRYIEDRYNLKVKRTDKILLVFPRSLQVNLIKSSI